MSSLKPARSIQQLHLLAPHYWSKPETANCTILIPTLSQRSQRSPPSQASHPCSSNTANVDAAPHITLRLHTAYLLASSVFLRGLLSGVSPLNLIQKCYASRPQPGSVPRSRLPRILPSPPSHPVVFLPVPDPSSIQLLFQWMYFGSTDHIQNALDQGEIQWEGLVRNVEYLGLPTEIKVFLGRWYRDWLLPTRCSPDPNPCPADEDDSDDDISGVDSEYNDSDSDDCYSLSSTPSTDDEPGDRGRTRDIKPLVQLLRLCTT